MSKNEKKTNTNISNRDLPISTDIGQFLTEVNNVPIFVDINSFRATGALYKALDFNSLQTISISITQTWYIVPLLTAGESLNATLDASAGTITVGLDGYYNMSGFVTWRVTSATARCKLGIGIAGSTPTAANQIGGQDLDAALYNTTGFSTHIRLTAGQSTAIYVWNDQGTQNIQIAGLHFNIVKIAN